MPSPPFPIVGVGASAGGVEALQSLFKSLGPEPGLAFVVVTHLSPERESLLAEVLARFTAMPVLHADDGIEVRNNVVYVPRTSASVSIAAGRLRVAATPPGRRERHPIDGFLVTLARDSGRHAASVILSGGDGDGALGTRAIRRVGGLTLAQGSDGSGPSHPDMPRSAVRTGAVDVLAPAEQLGRHLVAFAQRLSGEEMAEEGGGDAEVAADRDPRREICAILRSQVGHDFSGYKARTFARRVRRRMQVAQLDAIESYIDLLQRDPAEAGALFRDLLINVTGFFRDPEAFAALDDLVLARLAEQDGAAVRVWVPGCSTGEEVYSLAMLLIERAAGRGAPPRLQIFASDIDERALAVARLGRYAEAAMEGVTPDRRRRFFTHDGGLYTVRREVRDLCIFSPHSLIRDAPFSHIDLVSCRNLLIYFGAELQALAVPTFHYALRPGGCLFLGSSESLSQFTDLFVPLDKRLRVFQRRDDDSPAPRLPLSLGLTRSTAAPIQFRTTAAGGTALRQSVERQVLDRYAPAHVVVTRDGDVAYFSGRTGKYLEPAAGAPTRQLLNLARKGLRLDLRTTLAEALDRQSRVVREGVSVEIEDGRVQDVTLVVEPYGGGGEGRPLMLVLFIDQGPPRDAATAPPSHAPGDRAERLELELREVRDRVQPLIEEYETALEELKSSNEELVSVNEELQSANEELEASKEELQSLNEELQTVNAELNHKVEALDRANGDLRNLFASTPLATVFLDRNLVIRSFTPAVGEIFNILPGDHGRPLTDLASRVEMPDLSADVSAAFASGRTIERRVGETEAGPRLLVRLAPYRGVEDIVEGVVVIFMDVSSLLRAAVDDTA